MAQDRGAFIDVRVVNKHCCVPSSLKVFGCTSSGDAPEHSRKVGSAPVNWIKEGVGKWHRLLV